MASTRFSGQPFASASSISGSSFAWSRTTPDTTSRKNAASAGRYLSPSTSPPSPGLRVGVDGDDAVAERKPFCHSEVYQRTGGLDRYNFEMDGIAPDHAAQRDHGIVGLTAVLGGLERDRDRGRNFQRAGHRNDV